MLRGGFSSAVQKSCLDWIGKQRFTLTRTMTLNMPLEIQWNGGKYHSAKFARKHLKFMGFCKKNLIHKILEQICVGLKKNTVVYGCNVNIGVTHKLYQYFCKSLHISSGN